MPEMNDTPSPEIEEEPTPSTTGFFQKIVERLNWQVMLTVTGVVVAVFALFLQFSDSKSSTENSEADRNEASIAYEQREKVVESNQDIAKSLKKPDVPALEAFVEGTSRDNAIIDFVDANQSKVFHLKLHIPADKFASPADRSEFEELSLGCTWMDEGCDSDTSGALVFNDECFSFGGCVGWYSGQYKIDGYFTVVATQMQMGEFRFVLRPVPPEMVRLR